MRLTSALATARRVKMSFMTWIWKIQGRMFEGERARVKLGGMESSVGVSVMQRQLGAKAGALFCFVVN